MLHSLRPLGKLSLVLAIATCLVAGWLPASPSAFSAPRDVYDAQAESDATPKPYAPGRLIVKFKSEGALSVRSGSVERLNRRAGLRAARRLFKSSKKEDHRRIQARFPHRTRRTAPTVTPPDLTATYLLDVSPAVDAEALAALYTRDSNVVYAQPDYVLVADMTPNDPYYASSGNWGQSYDDLWGLKRIRADAAWDVTQGQGITVAVVDTGLDLTHPDITANVWHNPGELPGNGVDDDGNGYVDDVQGWDFTTCAQFDALGCPIEKTADNDPTDEHGHGTHVSGIIGAIGDNGVGIIGVAPQVSIMPVRGLNAQGSGYSSDLASAIVYAADNGAEVINNSWGCSTRCPSNPVVEDAVRVAHAQGAVVVFAAGNSASDVAAFSPQNMLAAKPIVVAASAPDELAAAFSNRGFLVDVAAPGAGLAVPPPSADPIRGILSLKAALAGAAMTGSAGQLIVGEQYLRQAGTSMATPYVSGVAALVLARNPSFSNDDVRQVLRTSADDIHTAGTDPMTGAGRLDAAAALAVSSVLKASIDSPGYWFNATPQGGPIDITGTAAGENFSHYTLAYGQGAQPASWVPLAGPVGSPVNDGLLGSWDPAGLPDDLYALRLSAVDTAGQAFEAFTQVLLERMAPRQLTTDAAYQNEPDVSEKLVVWQDLRAGNYDIYVYDTETLTERAITDHPAHQRFPAVSGTRIVWQDDRHGNSEIYLYDLATNTERRITNNPALQREPDIDGNLIVWADYRNGLPDIYLYDLATNTERRITKNSNYQLYPAVSGTRIVWEDLRFEQAEIYSYDVVTKRETRLTNHPADQYEPAIDGDLVIWQDDRNNHSNLYLYDFSTKTQRPLAPHAWFQSHPAISGTMAAWVDGRKDMGDIYLYDIQTNTEQSVTIHPDLQTSVAIDQGRIVWSDYRNGAPDIYMVAPNQPPTIDPVGNHAITPGTLAVIRITGHDGNGEQLAFTAAPLPAGAVVLPLGDVTQDGGRTAADTNHLAQCVNGTATCTPEQAALGDVAGPGGLGSDGQLTLADVNVLEDLVQGQGQQVSDPQLLPLLNTALLLWRPTAGQSDEAPYYVTVSVQDPPGAVANAVASLLVMSSTTNLLTNGGFEAGKTEWSGWGTSIGLSTETSYTGLYSAKLTLGATAIRKLNHPVLAVAAGQAYRVCAVIKTIGLGTKRAYVELKWKKPGGGLIRTDVVAPAIGTTDWVKSLTTVVAPTGAAKLDVTLVTDSGAGTAYFDAIRVE